MSLCDKTLFSWLYNLVRISVHIVISAEPEKSLEDSFGGKGFSFSHGNNNRHGNCLSFYSRWSLLSSVGYHALFLPECEVTFVVGSDKYWHTDFLARLITPENSKTSKTFRNEKQLSSPDNDAICIFSKGRLDQELSYFYIQSTEVSISYKGRTPKNTF